mgnify:FL=1
MTKRRKLYEEKRAALRVRKLRAIDSVVRGMDPDTIRKRYNLHDRQCGEELRAWYIPPKRKSLVERIVQLVLRSRTN